MKSRSKSKEPARRARHSGRMVATDKYRIWLRHLPNGTRHYRWWTTGRAMTWEQAEEWVAKNEVFYGTSQWSSVIMPAALPPVGKPA
jgi:hypothetical protein